MYSQQQQQQLLLLLLLHSLFTFLGYPQRLAHQEIPEGQKVFQAGHEKLAGGQTRPLRRGFDLVCRGRSQEAVQVLEDLHRGPLLS